MESGQTAAKENKGQIDLLPERLNEVKEIEIFGLLFSVRTLSRTIAQRSFPKVKFLFLVDSSERDFFNDFCGYSCNNCIGGNVFCNDGSGCNDCVISDDNSG